MSGMLDISDKVAWMPAGWVFDGVLELIAAELKTENPSLAAALLQARTEATGYCDIRTLDATQFRSLLEAVERTYARLLEEKTIAFHNTKFRAGFINQFQELKALLSRDARVVAASKA